MLSKTSPRGKQSNKATKKTWWVLALKVLLLLVWTAAATIVAQLMVGYLMYWILGRETFVQVVPTAIYSALSYIVTLVWLIFATPKIITNFDNLTRNKTTGRKGKSVSHSVDRTDLGLRDAPTWTDIGLAPIGYIASTLLAMVLVGIFSVFPWFNADQAQDVGFGPYLVGMDRVVAFIVLVVVAPIAEELVFRGWLYGKLRTMLNTKLADMWSMVVSILLVSLLFGAIHMQWNVGVNVFALSVVLCGMRELTGTIYAGILTHMIKNGVAFFILYVIGFNMM